VVLATLLLFALAGCAWMLPRLLLDRVVFQPTPGRWLSLDQLGIRGEEVSLRAEDGVELHAFFLPSPGATRAILFLHGNAGNASHRLPNAALMAGMGAHVLLPDYRGYGLSAGAPSERGSYADARAALAHLVSERAIPESRVILFGRSLGGAVAVDLAQGRELGGVILESTFSSASDVADLVFTRPLGAVLRGRWDSAGKIARVRAPLLFVHGARDQIVPIELGRRLFDVAPEPKAFETLANAGHNTTVELGGRAYLERLAAFVDEVAP
jgi:pimeloyl-ACP methyl ester carboxylesterase